MKRSISVRIVTVLFAATLFGAYVVYSQLARTPESSRQSQRAIGATAPATNAPLPNRGMVAPGSKSRAPLLVVSAKAATAPSNIFELPPSAMMMSSTKTIVLDPKLTQRLIMPGTLTNMPPNLPSTLRYSEPSARRIVDSTSKSAGLSLARQVSTLITNNPTWTGLFNSNSTRIAR